MNKLVVFVVLVITVSEASVRSIEDNEIGSDSPIGDPSSVNQFIKKVMSKKCLRQLSSTCLKLGLVRIVEQMSRDSYYQLLPGVSLSTNSTEAEERLLLPELAAREDRTLQQRIDYYLLHRVSGYLKSLTLHIKLADVDLQHHNASEPTHAYSVLDVVTGRRNKGNNNGLLAMGLMFAGTMLTMALSGLAALAGKAMMTAMLSLVLSAISAMKNGHGGAGKSTTYEIIHKPEVSHSHTHSSEVQYDHGHMYRRSLYR